MSAPQPDDQSAQEKGQEDQANGRATGEETGNVVPFRRGAKPRAGDGARTEPVAGLEEFSKDAEPDDYRQRMINNLLALVACVLLVGAGTGLLCAALSYFGVWAMGGINFRVAFFPAFFIPVGALWWGPAIGAGTALVGSFIPAWGARSIKVSEVFSKVA